MNLIKEKIELGTQNGAAELNIAYGVDKGFLFGSGLSMNSIIINNQDIKLKFHLFTDYINDDFLSKLERLTLNQNVNIDVYIINSDELKKLPISHVWSYATYFRFFIFDHLCESLSSILYLDADVFCKGSLKHYTNIEFNGEYAAVIPDVPNMQVSCVERLSMPQLKDKYFNAGVIFLNLKAWDKDKFTKQAFNLITDNHTGKTLKYLDQDALNIIFNCKNIYLPRDYNCIYTLKNELEHKNYKDYITSETKLIHYTGATKPWHYWAVDYPASQTFKIAFETSPWKNDELVDAKKKPEYQERYKHEFNQKKFLAGLSSLIKYKKFK
ncbi:lipopolysaccharide 1,2-glucosyltransferase [Providencia alcalifaciens]|uniref:glycosyltransferase family 8 protein n=1 Tax=Providencia alcalifaciens TaxID=126385 RepID=UPI001CE16FBD|nr:glycosyltransferase [Providencia alcalifaciens]UBX50325.1 lipopolysaccharide 1,2-glucosyltransferase [Providencia alcalifaciens]